MFFAFLGEKSTNCTQKAAVFNYVMWVMPKELTDIIVDTLAGDDEDHEEIPKRENVVDLIFDALSKRGTGLFSYQMHVHFCSIKILNAFLGVVNKIMTWVACVFFVSDKNAAGDDNDD